MIAAVRRAGRSVCPIRPVLGLHLFTVLPGKGADASADAVVPRLEFRLAGFDRVPDLLAPDLRVHAPGRRG